LLAAGLGVAGFSLVTFFLGQQQPQAKALEKAADKDDEKPDPAPELEGGTAWLNTAAPIRLKDLKGKFVLLDFWTYCCINCIHTLPDLARLEKKYANQLVVIGVHSAKFDNEKDSEAIRKAILRYEIEHPVVNDPEMKIWRSYGARAWPTLALIDPEGNHMGNASGEGNFELIDKILTKYIPKFREKKVLNEKPIKFELARFSETGRSPLFFPGKVLADQGSNRLFIADSTHHRIVITNLEGKKIAVAGNGLAGKADGDFDSASFNDPQGLAVKGDLLFVADRKNHLIRELDLKRKKVRTVAGSGDQGTDRRVDSGKPLEVGLNSPWDLTLIGDDLYIAMAGFHQIWKFDLKKEDLKTFAGAGPENIRDGPLNRALFAQPSGLTTDGKVIYVADSEVSAIRAVPLDGDSPVTTLVGEGLFDFGDVDGTGEKVRLQHALGVGFKDGKVYIADTYNSKIKVLDPQTKECKTFLGGQGDGWIGGPLFLEPGGLSFAGDKLFVADTNAHRIRVVDLKAKKVSTLKLDGVDAPKMP
jgi:thiol-disulfide isomerase/thioredoxin